MSTDLVLAGCAGMIIGWIAAVWRTRPTGDDWRLERRIDALMAHHGLAADVRLPDEVVRLMGDGRTVDAVRAYREATGAGLKDAYDTIRGRCAARQKLDALLKHLRIEPDRSIPDDVRRLAGEGRTIEAIRALRERTGMDLAAAKEAIESGRLPA